MVPSLFFTPPVDSSERKQKRLEALDDSDGSGEEWAAVVSRARWLPAYLQRPLFLINCFLSGYLSFFFISIFSMFSFFHFFTVVKAE